MKSNTMKYTFLFLAAAVVFLSIIWSKQAPEHHSRSAQLTIGVIGPLTGPASAYGQWVKTGVTAALEDLKTANRGRISVLFEDDQGDPKKSVTAYQKLKAINDVDAVISVLSSGTLALKSNADTDEVVLISPVASHPKVTMGSPYTFRNTINSAQEAKAMVAYLAKTDESPKSICIVYINDPGGLASKEAFKSTYQGKIQAIVPFEKRKFDFRDVALQVSSNCKDVQALYVTGYGKEMGGVIRDLRNQGIQQPIYTNQGIENKDVLNILGELAKGIEYTFLPDAKEIPPSIASRENKPSPAVLMAYEATTILAEAFRLATETNSPVIDVLRQTEFQGILSKVRFDANGDVRRPIAVKRVGPDGRVEQLSLVKPDGE